MSLPRFLDRVVDATEPLLSGLDRDAVRTKLEAASVTLSTDERAADGVGRAGYLLAANLAARLYPRIVLAGPADVVRSAEDNIRLINPHSDVVVGTGEPTTATLGYETAVAGPTAVTVAARGWNVYIDTDIDDAHRGNTAPLAALLAATLGVAELFRIVFANELGDRGRAAPRPAAFNLVTLKEPRGDLPLGADVDVGEFRLVGAGAIGQAAAHALSVTRVRGRMVAVDPEKVALSNLQRYVLTTDTDVDVVKVDLLRDRLAASALEVVPVSSDWHADLVEAQRPTLVALDSPEARIGVQSSLPGPIYNAWTQPADVGWSRHEHFGEEACLACLYWPERAVPSRHEQIAAAFGQHPLRVLAYLVHRAIPIGLPLPPGGVPAIPGFEPPPDAARWLATPLVEDIAAAAGVEVAELAGWRDRPLADVYRDGICGGALLHLKVGEAPRDVVVPLSHQSAFAGVMLATSFLVAQVPELRAARAAAIEGRFDVLAGLPQVLARPRARTPGCLCGDAVFLAVYRGKFGDAAKSAHQAAADSDRG